jgi:RNA 3'-terminal phosphate cyclase (ATP)
MESGMVELDGSMGEGGGQILRSSLALSLLTARPFHLRNVRAGRAKPGLQPQHLMSVRAAGTVGRAQTRGAARGSTDLVFEPGAVTAGSYRFDIGTAGAVGLVLHTIYLPLALAADAPSEIALVGGTHVKASPCFHFLDTTWRSYLAACGLTVGLRMLRPGFYPRGGGEVRAVVQPCAGVRGQKLFEHGPVRATGFSAVAGLPESIARRQARRARFRLEQHDIEVELEEQTWEGGPGTVIGIELNTTPAPTLFFAIGERGRPAERVADEAADQVLAYLAAAPNLVDAHSADQMVLPLALAAGPSEYRVAEVTRHLTTNIAVIGHFLDRKIECAGAEGGPGVVRIH